MKKLLAFVLASAMMLSLAACGGSGDNGGGGGGGNPGDIQVTIFNTKSEINSAMEQMAAAYSESHEGVHVEVYMSNDTVAAHMATKYSSGDPYVISMVDAKDIYSLGPEHAIDLSDQPYVANTSDAISIDGKVLGVPFCVEARGLMYNATAIEAITGKTFNPDDYKTLDAFKGLLDELKAGGMAAPVGIMKEDWSLAGHFLAEVYEMQNDMDAYVADLKAGNVDLMSDARFNALMDYFDVMKENNYAASSPIAAERETSEMMLAEGQIAFMFGGNWDWAQMAAFDTSEKIGMMPVPQNTSDKWNTVMMGGGSKYLFIDNASSISDEQRQAAKDFLTWLFTDAEGNKWLTEDFMLVPAYTNIAAASLDPLGTAVNEYFVSGKTVMGYNFLPDDHYSKMGAEMQKYLAGQCSRADLASAIQAYWTAQT